MQGGFGDTSIGTASATCQIYVMMYWHRLGQWLGSGLILTQIDQQQDLSLNGLEKLLKYFLLLRVSLSVML